MEHLRQHDLQAVQAEDQFNQDILSVINAPQGLISGPVYSVPTVIHVLHAPGDTVIGSQSNPTDAEILAAFQSLNQGFRNVSFYDSSRGVDTEIEFCLTTQDSNGVYSTGITRHNGPTNVDVVQTDYWTGIAWDQTKYLNIYICSTITLGNGSFGGYGFFPSNHGTNRDGFLVANWTVNSPLAATLWVHEAGHYLGLYHTFGGGCTNNNCQTDNDRVCDTPPDNSAAFPANCADSVNTCITDTVDLSANNPFRPVSLGGLGDQLDPVYNHMDYTGSVCRQEFTQGQKDRMRAALTGTRASLLTGNQCLVVCAAPPMADFTASDDTVDVLDTLFLTNASTNSSQFEWQIDNVPFSTATDTGWVFTASGWYRVTLVATGDSAACGNSSLDVWIYVRCPVISDFTGMVTEIGVGDALTLTDASSGATSRGWYLDGVLQGSGTQFVHTFNSAGMYEVQLKSSNGQCPDSSDTRWVAVGRCFKGQDEQWQYGFASGQDFRSGAPSAYITTGFNATQGSASIADENGNLLFYTNGAGVWNRQFNPMPGSTVFIGNRFGDQILQILPMPGDSNLYYIFYVEYTPTYGLWYATVDMRLDSGRGAVTSVGNQLGALPYGGLTAVRHANGCDYWLTAWRRWANETYLYKVTSTGIDSVGMRPLASGFGQVKYSLDGTRYAVANGGNLFVYNFNASTGQFSNSIMLTHALQPFNHGVAFSPNGRFLYAGIFDNGNGTDRILQFDLNAGNQTAIQNSMTLVAAPVRKMRSLQNGPDGRIYVPQEFINALAVIEYPNRAGTACGYAADGTDVLPGALSRLYLPNLAPTFGWRTELGLQGPLQVCVGSQNVEYTLACSDSTIWDYRGGGSVASSAHTLLRLDFGAAGTDTLIVQSWYRCGPELSDTLLINVGTGASLDLGNDTTLCPSASLTLMPQAGLTVLQWQNGATTPSLTVSGAGLYWVEVQDNFGCIQRDSLTVHAWNQPPPMATLGPDTAICPGSQWLLVAGNSTYTYLWQNNSTDTAFTINSPGLYAVTVSDACGQTASDSVLVSLVPAPLVSLGNDSTLCIGDSLLLTAGSPSLSYLWQDNSILPTYTVTQAGTYSVQATDHCGQSASDTIVIGQFPAPMVDIGNDTILCPGATLPLDAGSGFAAYVWQNGASSSTLLAGAPGWYAVTVTDACGLSATDSLLVSPDAPQGVQLGNDTVLCQGDQIALDAGAGFGTYTWQNGASTQTLTVTTPGTYSVTVTNPAGCSYSDTLVITPCVGVPEVPDGIALRIFPNPTTGQPWLEVTGVPVGEAIAWQVYDLAGRRVMAGQTSAGAGRFRKRLDLRGLSDGWYRIAVVAGGHHEILSLALRR